MSNSQLYTVSDIVRRVEGRISPDAIRRAEDRGELRAVRTVGGTRLFTEREVERWIAKRQREADDAASAGDAA